MRSVATTILAACLAAGLSAAATRADTYPSKPVQVISQFNPTAVADILARAISEEISQILGQQFVVVSRDGASGVIAHGALAAAKPDGYTIGFGPQGALTIQPHLQKSTPYTLESFQPICQTFENNFAVVVGPNARFKAFPEIVAEARAQPGKINWGVFGIGTVPHMQFHSVLRAARLEMTQVPYKVISQIAQDTISSQIDLGIMAFSSFSAFPVRPLATLASERIATHPDVPSMKELGYPVSEPAFGGFIAPKGTPPEIMRTLEAACAKAVTDEKWIALAKRTGTPTPYLDGAGLAKRLAADWAAKGELIGALGIKVG